MRYTIWIGFAAFLIAGCTTITPSPRTAPPTQASWQNREQKLSQLQRWQLSGKIGVQTAQNSGSATLNWWQNQKQYSIALSGPLGSGGLKLSGHPGNVTMVTADGKQYTASSPEQLLAQHGWRLPISNLQYWIRGMPVPGIPANTQFDSYNRLSRLSQQGATIQYLSYINRNGMELPQRINIASPNLTAKIVIYDWNT